MKELLDKDLVLDAFIKFPEIIKSIDIPELPEITTRKLWKEVDALDVANDKDECLSDIANEIYSTIVECCDDMRTNCCSTGDGYLDATKSLISLVHLCMEVCSFGKTDS